MAKPFTVLIVDDHEVVYQGPPAYLGAQAEFEV